MTESSLDDAKKNGSAGWLAVGGALLLGAVVGALVFAVTTPPAPRSVVEAAPAAAVVAAAPREGDIAKLLKVEAPAEAAPVEVSADEVLICGQAMPRAAFAEERVSQTLQEVGAVQALTQFAQAQLTQDEHARAVGLVLRLHADATYGERGYASCQSDDCFKEAARLHTQRVGPLVTELATLAAGSSDPRVMALAREQCTLLAANDKTTLPHCEPLSARRLVALERDNAAAWLALAAEEPAAKDEAMYQAGIAPRWDDHGASARRFIDRVDAKGGLRSMVLMAGLLTTQSVQSTAGTQLVTQHCSAAAVAADANRRLQCEQIEQGLRARSTSLMGLATAAALAKSLGHPDAQTRHDDARLLAHVLQTRESDEAIQEADARECAWGLPRELLLRSAREGEVPALRALLQADEASLAQWRESLAAADAAEAASRKLASAASAETAASAPRLTR